MIYRQFSFHQLTVIVAKEVQNNKIDDMNKQKSKQNNSFYFFENNVYVDLGWGSRRGLSLC